MTETQDWLKRKARQAKIESRHKELHLLFVEQIKDAGLPLPIAEYPFAHPRKWRFDYCWFEQRIALEVEGGHWLAAGHHGHGVGFQSDVDKYNLATYLGWAVYRATSEMIEDGSALNWVVRALTGPCRCSSTC